MSIRRLQHIGVALAAFARAAGELERIGLPTRDFRNDQGRGFQHDARVLLGNDCWLHVVYNWNPESRVNQFLKRHGQGLEHLALESDDIEADVARVREQGVPIFEDRIFDANDGFEAFVYPDDAIGFTVELIQPHATSWTYPEAERGRPASDELGVIRASSIGAVVSDVELACQRFAALFDLPRIDERGISLGNLDLHLLAAHGDEPGLRYVVLETEKGADAEHDIGFRIHLKRSRD